MKRRVGQWISTMNEDWLCLYAPIPMTAVERQFFNSWLDLVQKTINSMETVDEDSDEHAPLLEHEESA